MLVALDDDPGVRPLTGGRGAYFEADSLQGAGGPRANETGRLKDDGCEMLPSDGKRTGLLVEKNTVPLEHASEGAVENEALGNTDFDAGFGHQPDPVRVADSEIEIVGGE